jgi:hypothetical protein
MDTRMSHDGLLELLNIELPHIYTTHILHVHLFSKSTIGSVWPTCGFYRSDD